MNVEALAQLLVVLHDLPPGCFVEVALQLPPMEHLQNASGMLEELRELLRYGQRVEYAFVFEAHQRHQAQPDVDYAVGMPFLDVTVRLLVCFLHHLR